MWLVRRPWVALVAAIAVQVFVFLYGQRDLAASDPLWYAAIAHRLAMHPGELFTDPATHPFVMRVGLTGPVALLYLAFGVSTLTTNLPCLFAAVGILAVVYAAMPTPRAKLIAMAIATACAPLVARDATMLNPDLPCAALMAASILALARRRLLLAMVVWFAAFLVKETALWCAPIWIYALVRDRHALRAYVPAVVTGGALALAYILICAVVWDDPLARFHGIDGLDHSWSLSGQPASAWLARLTWQPASMLWRMFGPVLVFAIGAPWLVREPRDRLWPIAALVMVALYWFGPSSLHDYSPLPLLVRMALPLVPFILAAAALAIDWTYELVLPRIRRALTAALVVTLAFHLWRVRQVGGDRSEQAAYAMLRREAAQHAIVVVCGDPRGAALAGLYFGFEPPPTVTIVEPPAFTPRPGASVRVIVERHRAAEVGSDVAQRLAGLPRLFDRGGVTVFDAGDGAQLAALLHQ